MRENLGDALTLYKGIGNALDVGGAELVVFALLGVPLGGVNDKYILALALLAQHHNDGGNARAKENVGGQTDDGVNVVVLNQIFADRAFLTAAEQNTVGQNDGHNAVWLDMVEVVQQKGIVRLTLGCQTKAGIAASPSLLVGSHAWE